MCYDIQNRAIREGGEKTEREFGNRGKERSRLWELAALILILFPVAGYAYHPLNTDDPGTVEYRGFELESGNYFLFPETALEESCGYLAIKGGLSPDLEFDAVANYTYRLEIPEEKDISGWRDSQFLFKYRFLGDGQGPFNLGLEGIANFPSGEKRKGLSSGDEISPTLFLIGSFGKEPVRVLVNLGWNFIPDPDDSFLFGAALEWTVNEKLILAGEIIGNNDLKNCEYQDPLGASLGMVYGARDWLTLSAGVGADLSESSETDDYYLTLGALFGWGGGE